MYTIKVNAYHISLQQKGFIQNTLKSRLIKAKPLS